MKLRRIDPGSRQQQIPIRRLAIPAIAGTKLVASPCVDCGVSSNSGGIAWKNSNRPSRSNRTAAISEIAMGGSPG